MAFVVLGDITPLDQYTATASQTDFIISWNLYLTDPTVSVALAEQILVFVDDVLQTIITDYTVVKSDDSTIVVDDLFNGLNGSKVVFNVGLTVGQKVSISRDLPVKRATGFPLSGDFSIGSLNVELNKILAIQQELERDIARSIVLSASDAEGGSLELPAGRASKFLAFDASSNVITAAGTIGTAIVVSSFMETVLDDTTATAALATLGLVVSPYAKTILDDTTAGEVLTTLGVSTYAQTILDDTTALLARQTLLLDKKAGDIASATTTDLDVATGDLVDITGTTTITAITLSEGQERTVRFTGILTLTDGASLLLPGAANIVTVDGDTAVFRGYASSVVRCINYTKLDGKAVISPSGLLKSVQTFTSSGTWTKPAGINAVMVEVQAGGGGGGDGGTTAGSSGGSSSFGSFLSATGGAGGEGGSSAGDGGLGGLGSGGDINIKGGDGTPGHTSGVNSNPSAGSGGNSFFSGSGRGGSSGSSGSNGSNGGGGGADSESGNDRAGAGGGAGGYSKEFINSGLGSSETITVGMA